jgi:hypothetical protein
MHQREDDFPLGTRMYEHITGHHGLVDACYGLAKLWATLVFRVTQPMLTELHIGTRL